MLEKHKEILSAKEEMKIRQVQHGIRPAAIIYVDPAFEAGAEYFADINIFSVPISGIERLLNNIASLNILSHEMFRSICEIPELPGFYCENIAITIGTDLESIEDVCMKSSLSPLIADIDNPETAYEILMDAGIDPATTNFDKLSSEIFNALCRNQNIPDWVFYIDKPPLYVDLQKPMADPETLKKSAETKQLLTKHYPNLDTRVRLSWTKNIQDFKYTMYEICTGNEYFNNSIHTEN